MVRPSEKDIECKGLSFWSLIDFHFEEDLQSPSYKTSSLTRYKVHDLFVASNSRGV